MSVQERILHVCFSNPKTKILWRSLIHLAGPDRNEYLYSSLKSTCFPWRVYISGFILIYKDTNYSKIWSKHSKDCIIPAWLD